MDFSLFMQFLSKHLFLFSLLLFFFIVKIQAQTFSYKNFTIEDGLPSTEVYKIFQDHSGFIWLATNQGLCRYNGYGFETFTTKDGITENIIIDIFEDHRNRIWFSTSTKGFFYFENGKFFAHPLNSQIIDTLANRSAASIFYDENDTLWFTSYAKPNIVYKISPENNFLTETPIQLLNQSGDKFYCIHKTESKKTVLTLTFPNNFTSAQNLQIKFKNNYFFSNSLAYKLCHFQNAEYLFSLNNSQLMSFNKETNIIENKYNFENIGIDEILIDKEKNTLVCTNKGVFLFENQNFEKPKNLFPEEYISHSIQDKSGNYWFATLDHGVYFLPCISFQNLELKELENDPVTALSVYENEIYLGTFRGNLFKINPDFSFENIHYSENKSQITSILKIGDSNIYLSNGFYLKEDKIAKIPSFSRSKILIKASNGGFYAAGGSNSKIQKIVNNNEIEAYQDQRLQRTFGMVEGKDHNLWLATLEGLFEFKNNELIAWNEKDSLLNFSINGIVKQKNNCLWMSSSGAGLIIKNGNQVKQITEEDGLLSNFNRSIYLENDSTIWLGSNKGLNKIYIRSNLSKIKKIESFTKEDGIISNRIESISGFGNKIWIGTNKGLCKFNSENLQINLIPPSVNITKIKINGIESPIRSTYDLKYTQNEIELDFVGICARSEKNITYRFKLKNHNENFKNTKTQNIQYTNLKDGNYTFQLFAANKDGVWTKEPLEINFYIKTPFFKTWWFIVGIVLFVCFLFYILVNIIIRNHKKKHETELHILESEQKALRSQMNPHFIFNAMNSIQFFITENDKKNALNYLSKFSKLMRNVLENSKFDLINLEEEINNLEKYVQLEQMRYGNKFDFELVIDDSLDFFETKIPPMMIQPFVENAIWHGLSNKKENGFLKISFKVQNNSLICRIQDNGIGRKQAERIKQKRISNGKSSTGIKNIQDRIQLINARFKTQMKIEIKDLYNKKNEAIGTKALIYFPFFN